MFGLARETKASNFCVNRGASINGTFETFDHDGATSLTKDDAIPGQVIWAGRADWRIRGFSEYTDGTERGECKRCEGSLGAAGDDGCSRTIANSFCGPLNYI